jgi:hypothetical protein
MPACRSTACGNEGGGEREKSLMYALDRGLDREGCAALALMIISLRTVTSQQHYSLRSAKHDLADTED